MKSIVLLCTIVVALTLPAPIDAHHASAGIDQSAMVEVDGTILQFRWANPHSWIELEVVNSEGETEIWNFEMLPPSYLIRAGWTRSTITEGDEVTIVARPMRDGSPGGLFISIVLPDGRELAQRAARGGGGD